MVNVLLASPKNPRSFWTFDETLMIAGKKSGFPPAGLLTVAGMLPERYNLKLVDENVEELKDEHFRWADVVLTSSMIIHWKSLERIISRANQFEKPVLAGGPLSTQYHHEIRGNATYFLGEAEAGSIDVILEDIVKRGYRPETRVIDKRKRFENMTKVPLQRFDLIKDNLKYYIAMAIQTTRGCPESCTFCNIPSLYGKITRVKEASNVVKELQLLHNYGWRGGVMIVDDNLVGNQKEIIPILHEIKDWQKENKYPFNFITQASLRMYENPELMEAMYQAGFSSVFFGLESPSQESLKFMGAQKNLQGKNERGKTSMLEKIRDIQANYFQAYAGFILGFDTDPDNIAKLMKAFIQDARISVAMVGPLGVLPDTPDYERYKREKRLVEGVRYGGDSGIFSRELSYVPMKNGERIDPNVVLDRHREVVGYINSPGAYFERTLEYIKNRNRKPLKKMVIGNEKLMSFLRSVYYQGVKSDYKGEYWNFLWNVVKNDISSFPEAVGYAAQGHHLITTTNESLKVDDVNTSLEKMLGRMGELSGDAMMTSLEKMLGRIGELSGDAVMRSKLYLEDIIKKYKNIREDFRNQVKSSYRKLIENSPSY